MALTAQHIVIYGGTFDPFHLGHLAVAQYLRDTLTPDKVLIVPAGRPWLRQRRPAAQPNARLTMCRLATDGQHGIEVSDTEIQRGGNTYTIDTISELRNHYGDTTRFDLAIGSDSIRSLKEWHRIDQLLQLCQLVIINRPGHSAPDATDIPENATVLEGPNIDIDATKIRRAYANSDYTTAAAMVPDTVHRYIITEELYWCVPTK